MTLQSRPERGREAWNRVDQALVRGAVDEQHFRIFDGVDEVRRRPALIEAGRVGQPPRFGRELKDVLLALGVNQVVAQAATGNKRSMPDDVTGTLEKSSC